MSKLLYSVQSVFALKGFNTYLKAYAVLERIYLKIVTIISSKGLHFFLESN